MTHSFPCYAFAISLPVYHLFDYEIDAEIPVVVGGRYRLPFGSSSKVGILIGISQNRQLDRKLKKVMACLDYEALIPESMLNLAQWLAQYYCQPLGEAIQLCIPRYLQNGRAYKSTRIKIWKSVNSNKESLHKLHLKAPKQYKILQAIRSHKNGMNALQLRQIHNAWQTPVKSLEQKGLVIQCFEDSHPVEPSSQETGPELTGEQNDICESMSGNMSAFRVHLLQGVTGSGKTEVYLRQIQQALALNRQVIYLVPEIGLTPQLLARVKARLGDSISLSHSAQTGFQRFKNWDQFRRGETRVMIGTRSALFSQCPNLGLIIIDEEHDASYRQQDGVRYHARDVAVKRAQMLDIPLIMGSATPSIESLYNLRKTHYQLYRLDQRVNQLLPPKIEIIDCSQVPVNAGCSPQLLQSVQLHLQNEGQVLLYLNRRGFAPVVMCHECGWQSECHQCDAKLTLHQSMNRLICHHCSTSIQLPEQCPSCGNTEIKHYGVGTEQLEKFLQQRFPNVPVVRIDRDSVPSAKQMEQKMLPVAEGDPCILIGTQMLAKGHDYPHITLVGILDADQALYSSFYRASERLIQTVLQVSGRAGRAHKKGEALLQTAFPQHELIKNLCNQSYSELIEPILQERQLLGFPPYHRGVKFQVDADKLDLSIKQLKKLKSLFDAMSLQPEVKVIGPIPALMTRRIGKYRAQLSLLAKDVKTIRLLMRQVMPYIHNFKNSKKSRLTIEVDPLDL